MTHFFAFHTFFFKAINGPEKTTRMQLLPKYRDVLLIRESHAVTYDALLFPSDLLRSSAAHSQPATRYLTDEFRRLNLDLPHSDGCCDMTPLTCGGALWGPPVCWRYHQPTCSPGQRTCVRWQAGRCNRSPVCMCLHVFSYHLNFDG